MASAKISEDLNVSGNITRGEITSPTGNFTNINNSLTNIVNQLNKLGKMDTILNVTTDTSRNSNHQSWNLTKSIDNYRYILIETQFNNTSEHWDNELFIPTAVAKAHNAYTYRLITSTDELFCSFYFPNSTQVTKHDSYGLCRIKIYGIY